MLKASSLSNAIFVCLMISIFSGCLVLISYYQNLLNSKLEFRESLIHTNNATFKFNALNLDQLDYNSVNIKDIFENGIQTYSSRKKWGFYDLLSSKTIFKDDTINRIGLIGAKKQNSNLPVLYATNYDRPLKLAGNSVIKGLSKIPNGSFEYAYINNQQGNSTSIAGSQSSSEDRLPRLNLKYDFDISQYKRVFIGDFKSKVIINSFDLNTVVLDISGISELRDITIKGNVIIYSSGSVNISPTAKISDAVLIAKKVTIASRFSGNLQIVSQNEVTLKKRCHLKYPSSIYVKNDTDSVKVHIEEHAIIAGGIIINGDTFKGSLKRRLIIDKSSKIYGSVYCYGSTQLQGEIIGEIYTDRFFLKTKSAVYENIILDGKISRDSLPKHFVSLPILNSRNDSPTYELIKEF